MTNTDPWLVVGVAAITATAVIFAAIIAAATAGRRQKRDLSHAAERQTAELNHAAERQKRELTHDRELTALDDRRAVLEEAAQLLLRLSEDVQTGIPPILVDHHLVPPVEARLVIRLGMSHPAAESFRDVIRAINELSHVTDAAPQIIERHGDQEFHRTKLSRESEMRVALGTFLLRAKEAAS